MTRCSTTIMLLLEATIMLVHAVVGTMASSHSGTGTAHTTTTFNSSNSSNSYSYTPSKLVANFEAFYSTSQAGTNTSFVDTSSCWAPNVGSTRRQHQQQQQHQQRGTTNGKTQPLKVAAIQLTAIESIDNDIVGFMERAVAAVRKAAKEGATLIVLPELFMGPYFCQSQDAILMNLATQVNSDNVILSTFQKLAIELHVVLPISIFESSINHVVLYNSVVMINSDGRILGTYRKSHIPDGTGYQEKFYFSPGDSGFQVFDTSVGKVGVGICWDQWFPEVARSMALLGATVLLYPTAIGSEPQDPTLHSMRHWQRTMQGHAAANMIPVVASNRYGTEILLHPDGTEQQRIHFYGKSFITDITGEIIQEAMDGADILYSDIDIIQNKAQRQAFGFFRDRRPDLYELLLTKDGSVH